MQEFLAIRERFPIFRDRVYLNSCAQGALATDVQQRVAAFVEGWNRNGASWEAWMADYDELRRRFAAFIGASPHEVAIVSSVSAAVNAVASCLDYRARPRVVMGEYEFPTMGHAWLAQQRLGAEVVFLRASGNRIPLERYAGAIDHRTLVVPVTGVSYVNGFRSPVGDIVELAHARGAWVMLDDYQDCGTRPVDVKALGVDFYLAGTVKYLLGTSGLAFLYVREELLERLSPTQSGWFGQRDPFAFDLESLDLAPEGRRFETGTPSMPAVAAALPALDLLRRAGPSRVAHHVESLARRLLVGLEARGFVAKTPADSVGPLVVVQSHDAPAVVGRLSTRGLLTSHRGDGVRIALHLYNSPEDVDAVLDLLDEHRTLMVSRADADRGVTSRMVPRWFD